MRLAAGLVATGIVSGLTLGAPDEPAEPGPDERAQRITELETRVERLRRQGEAWLTERRAEQIRDLVQDQTRYVYNEQDDANGNSTDSNRFGVEMRRTKVWVQGHVFDPTWTYKVKGNFDVENDNGTYESQEIFVQKAFDGLTIRVGQFKAPLLKEQMVSSMHQLAVDRSLINKRSDPDFPVGFQIAGEHDDWRWFVMVHNGITAAHGGWSDFDTEYAFSARVEFKIGGAWQQFEQYASRPGSERGLMLGAAINYENEEYGAGPPLPAGVDNEIESLEYTVDAMYHGDGWHVFAAFVAERQDNGADGPEELDRTPWGVVAQGGVFITDEWELFARYEYGEGDDSSIEDLSVLTVGFNRYFPGNHVKWSTDIGYGFQPVDSFWAQSSVGWRADEAGESGQIVIRSQLQLTF